MPEIKIVSTIDAVVWLILAVMLLLPLGAVFHFVWLYLFTKPQGAGTLEVEEEEAGAHDPD